MVRVKEQLKFEIDRLDEQYLELLFKIVCQFPHMDKKTKENQRSQKILEILHDISDSGGLGISNPIAWQHDVRQDRELPFRMCYNMVKR